MNYLLRLFSLNQRAEEPQLFQSNTILKFINISIILLVVTAFCDIGLGYDYHYAYKFTLPILVLGILFNFKHYSENLKEYITPLWFFIFGIAWYSLSLLWVDVFADGLYGLKRFILGHSVIFFGFFLINTKNLFNLFLKTLTIMYFIHLGICLLETLELFRWPISPMSEYLEIFNRKKVGTDSVHYQAPGVAESYPISFFYHPNDSSMVTMLGIPFILRNTSIPNFIRFTILPLSYWLYYKGENKAALIITSVYIIFLLASAPRVRKVLLHKISLALGFVFIVCFSILLNYGYKTNLLEFKRSGSTFFKYSQTLPLIISQRLQGKDTDFTQLQQNSIERFAYIDGALKEFSRRPISGIGVYGLKSKTHTVNFKKDHRIQQKTYPLKGIHFYWIEALTMGGIIFLAAYIFWYAWVLLQLYNHRKNDINFAVMDSLILFCVSVPVMSQAFFWLPKNLLYLTALLSLKFLPISPHNNHDTDGKG